MSGPPSADPAVAMDVVDAKRVRVAARSRGWCFTFNLPSDARNEDLDWSDVSGRVQGLTDVSGFKWFIVQAERGEETKRLHLQGNTRSCGCIT